MARKDLNAKRAARSEAENTPHELVLGFDAFGVEQVFLLRPRLPMEFSSLLRRGLVDEAMKLVLVNPDDWERFRAEVPDDDDLFEITELYEMVPGESLASTPSSNGDGPTSRPTSNVSTTSTSPPAAGDQERSASADSTS